MADKTIYYSGTKKVTGSPRTRGQYNEYHGQQTPKGENPNDDGYLVEHLNSPTLTPNHKSHDNYISWFPKVYFESAFKEIEHFVEVIKVQPMDKLTFLKDIKKESTLDFVSGPNSRNILGYLLSYPNGDHRWVTEEELKEHYHQIKID